MGPVILLIAAATLAAEGNGPAISDGSLVTVAVVPAAVVRDVGADLRIEGGKAARSAVIWTAIAVGSGVYAGIALSGGGGNEPVLKYLSFVGAIAGAAGAARSGWRAHSVGELRRGLDEAMAASAGEPGIRLTGAVVAGVGGEMHRRRSRIRMASRGALRAGCVLPVLLGGIGFYGMAVSSSGGDELAGVGLGGALVIGAPSMLSYWGLQERMKHIEILVQRWDDALLGQEKTQ